MVSSSWNRIAWQNLIFLLTFSLGAVALHARDQISANATGKVRKPVSKSTPVADGLNGNVLKITHDFFNSKIEMPPMPRISHSPMPLRQIKLRGNDQFVAECLDWDSKIATFRLLNGQMIQIPLDAISSMQNPPGEIDLVDESFETQLAADDRGVAGPGKKYQFAITPPSNARVELTFQTSTIDSTSSPGEWQLDWTLNQVAQAPLIVRIDIHGRITVSGIPAAIEATSQTGVLSDGRHAFIALFTQDRVRLILDDILLASFVAENAEIQAIEIRPTEVSAKNTLHVENLHARRLVPVEFTSSISEEPASSDRIKLASEDELFCRLIDLNRRQVNIEAFGEREALNWQDISAIKLRQPGNPISQSVPTKSGVVARIEMQPFVDRPECDSDHWKVTVIGVDATHVYAIHSLIGEIVFRCADIRRLIPQYFGKSVLIDARSFHLGNSIRSDLHRHIPDGTDLQGEFQLDVLPKSKPYFTFDLAELEASSPDAPPGSPFLAELRAGHLVTDLFVNDQKIGNVNEVIQYKANSRNPDRIRMTIPDSLLKPGKNTFRFQQQPLKQGGHEYDDCELGDIRLEFEN